MISIIEHKMFLRRGYIYFADKPLKGIDIGYYIQAFNDINTSLCGGYTLVTDLNQEEERIFSCFKSNVRNEIRSVSKIENVTIQRYQSNDISNDFIWDIIERHRHFHDTKGLKNEDRDVLMNRYSSLVEMGDLEISICLVGDRPMVFHVYIVDEDLVALNMSFSDFREHIDSAKIYGNLNRYLHWEDMKYFKSKGLKSYDWGGYNDTDSCMANVSKFKAGFGGTKERRFEGFAASSVKGHVYLKLREVKRRIKERTGKG